MGRAVNKLYIYIYNMYVHTYISTQTHTHTHTDTHTHTYAFTDPPSAQVGLNVEFVMKRAKLDALFLSVYRG